MAKRFRFDTILAAEDICNLNEERERLQAYIAQREKIVVYGPRNYGKTSLVKSVIIPEFEKKNKNSFVFFVDLMQVRNGKAVDLRMSKAFEASFAKSFPTKSLLESAKNIISSLRPSIEFDPITSQPSVSLNLAQDNDHDWWPDILANIRDGIAREYPCLLIFDEFQDLAFVDGAEGMIRNVLQEFTDVPIVIMGSKRHLLTNMFAVPSAPLFNFGIDLEFEPIEYEEYWEYMQERFDQKYISIDLETSTLLQDMLLRVPEPINMVCSEILNSLQSTTVTQQDIVNALDLTLEGRRGRFQTLLSLLSESEEDLLVALQKHGPIKAITGKDFLKHVDLSASGVRKVAEKLENSGVIESTREGYKIVDPLLGCFIDRYY